MPYWLSIGSIADILGILGAIAAFLAWIQSRKVSKELDKERQRKDKKIRVVLCHDDATLELPMEMRRAEFTRAELLGRLGMLPTENGKRFSLGYLNTAEFLNRLNEINMGNENDILLIPCTVEEFKQFNA